VRRVNRSQERGWLPGEEGGEGGVVGERLQVYGTHGAVLFGEDRATAPSKLTGGSPVSWFLKLIRGPKKVPRKGIANVLSLSKQRRSAKRFRGYKRRVPTNFPWGYQC